MFFTDNATAGLTSDTVAGSGTNLYRYDLSTGQLSDLTPVSDAEAGLVGISEDGSYVYFSSKGVLSGSEANQFGETAQNGQENLYLQHGGTLTFLRHAGAGSTVSANGAFLLTLNGYLYSAAANRFVSTGVDFGGPNFVGVHTASEHAPFLSNSGQVFFQEGGVLLPRDTDGQTNVYEFDYESGLHLISSGTSSTESVLLGASPSGNDVFFLARQVSWRRTAPRKRTKSMTRAWTVVFPNRWWRLARRPMRAARPPNRSLRCSGRRRVRPSPARATSPKPRPRQRSKSRR